MRTGIKIMSVAKKRMGYIPWMVGKMGRKGQHCIILVFLVQRAGMHCWKISA
jgi:hypothetical protein